jgi:hypothetical protein
MKGIIEMYKKLTTSSAVRAQVVTEVTETTAKAEEAVRKMVRTSTRSAKETVALLAAIDDYVSAAKEELRVRSFV